MKPTSLKNLKHYSFLLYIILGFVFFYFISIKIAFFPTSSIPFKDSVIILHADATNTLDDFFRRQHEFRVEIIKSVISDAENKDTLLITNKCIETVLALSPNPSIDFSGQMEIKPETALPVSGRDILGRLFLWLFFVVFAFLFNNVPFMTSDFSLLQELLISKISAMSDNYEMIEELYETLVELDIINDD